MITMQRILNNQGSEALNNHLLQTEYAPGTQEAADLTERLMSPTAILHEFTDTCCILRGMGVYLDADDPTADADNTEGILLL